MAVKKRTSTGTEPNPKAVEVTKTYERYLQKRRPWEPQWRDQASYIFPRRVISLQVRTPGGVTTERLFDSTAIFANEVLAAAIQSGVTNQSLKWFSLALRSIELNADDDVAQWLSDSTDQLLLAYRQSNLAAELHELYLDLGAFGVGAMLIEQHPTKKGALLFRALPIGSFCLDENAEGIVDTLYYTYKMSLRAVAKRYGTESFTDALNEKLKKDSSEEIELLHAIYPREGGRVGGRASKKPWASCVVLLSKDKILLSESGYDEFPAVVPRWTKASGEPYGRGPGHTALPDVRTLNMAVMLELKAWAKVLDPPLMAERHSIIGDVQIQPGGITIVRNMAGLKELTTNPRFDIGEMKKEELRQSIRNIYFVDQMLQLMARDRPQMTATEVQVKVQLLQQILGPTFGRLETELLNPLLDRSFNILMRNGDFAPAPQLLSGVKIDIEYEGPLIRAQRAQQLLGIERTIQLGAGLAAFAPDVWDNLDTDKVFRESGDISGIPQDLIRSMDDVVKIRQARQQQQQRQEELVIAAGGAEALGKVAPFVKAVSDTGSQQEAGRTFLPPQ